MPRPQPGVSTATPSTTWVDGSWPASCSWPRSGGCKEHRERRTRIAARAARADRVAPRDRRALPRRRVERTGVRRPLRRLPEHRAHARGRARRSMFESDPRAARSSEPIVHPHPQDARRQPRCALLHRARSRRPDVPRHRQPGRLRLPLVHGGAGLGRRRVQHARPRACCATPTSTSPPTAASRSSSAATRAANWLALPEGASELIVRCYFEEPSRRPPTSNRHRPADDRSARAGRSARAVGRRVGRGGLPPRHRVLAHRHARAGEAGRTRAAVVGVEHAERVPAARAARATSRSRRVDAAYSMAPYVIAPDEALVITGRWPRVPVRERRVVEPLPADLRLRAPARRPQPREHARSSPTAASAWSSRTRIPAYRTGSTPRARFRHGVLAVLPARGRGRDAAGPW